MSQDQLLTLQQVADRLQVSMSTVRRLVAAGKLTPARKLPGVTGGYLFSDIESSAA